MNIGFYTTTVSAWHNGSIKMKPLHSESNIHQKIDGVCLVVYLRSHPLQFHETWWSGSAWGGLARQRTQRCWNCRSWKWNFSFTHRIHRILRHLTASSSKHHFTGPLLAKQKIQSSSGCGKRVLWFHCFSLSTLLRFRHQKFIVKITAMCWLFRCILWLVTFPVFWEIINQSSNSKSAISYLMV